MTTWRMWQAWLGAGLGALLCAAPVSAQMVSGTKIPGFAATFGLADEAAGEKAPDYTAQFVTSTAPGNILWPWEQATFTVQIVNTTDRPLEAKGKLEAVPYGTRGRPGDVWVPDMFRLGMPSGVPISVSLKPKGYANITATPILPAAFGAYGLVVDLEGHGRVFITSCVRTFKPREIPVQYPQLALDVSDVSVLTRLGCFPNRIGIGYKPTTDKDFEPWFQQQAATLKQYKDAKLPITLEIGGGTFFGPMQPLGRPRPWLDDKGVMLDTKFDLAWLPSYDPDFRVFVKRFVAEFGWPKGPLNGIKLWNEPWNGLSISGWGADDERYREIFRVLSEATREACREAGTDVLIGGCDSSSNTFDKLFADGKDDWLQYLDFCSIHYQGMAPPSTVKAWVDRKGPHGRVRIWDTESWVANCDDRVSAVIATNLSTGHDRAVGIFGGNIASGWNYWETGKIFDENGKAKDINPIHTWSVAASVGAASHFIGERRFRELLFRNGLPWVMVFNGLPRADGTPDPEDGTVVVVGDIGDEFGHDCLLFRSVQGFSSIAAIGELTKELAALPGTAPVAARKKLDQALIAAQTLSGATLTLKAAGRAFALYDFYGNPVPPVRDGFLRKKVVVPLDHRGFFLRGDGQPGSFAKLLDALRSAQLAGFEPLATVAHDFTQRIEKGPNLRLTLTNVLNRPVSGLLTVAVGALTLEVPRQELAFAAHQTKDVTIKVTGGASVPGNAYPLKLRFDAGRDGWAEHAEDIRVNAITRRPITVDGDLKDWEGILPQDVRSAGVQPTLMETAWQPYRTFDTSLKQGFATGYLAADDQNFYFAAKIADATPDDGMVRYETRNDDEYFYPEKSFVVRLKNPGVAPMTREDTDTPKELVWPAGVRRYSYRKDPELPAGNFPNHDNVQLAFNLLPAEKKAWYPCPPGTMPGYIGYQDTDYEFALNPVAAKYGGGVEIWRLQKPGMPHKHFYPRSPKSPLDGPVKAGKLVVRRDGNTRLVEASLPWSEIPEAKAALDAGRTIKFSFRVNDNANVGCMELSKGRSVAKRNASFTVDWVEHWANELEFAIEK